MSAKDLVRTAITTEASRSCANVLAQWVIDEVDKVEKTIEDAIKAPPGTLPSLVPQESILRARQIEKPLTHVDFSKKVVLPTAPEPLTSSESPVLPQTPNPIPASNKYVTLRGLPQNIHKGRTP